ILKPQPMGVIYGIHAVGEAVKSRGRTMEYVAIARERHDARVQTVIDAARSAGVAVRFLPRDQLDRLAGTSQHQGIAAQVKARGYADVSDILEQRRGAKAFVLVRDGIEAPHNLGAVIRTADAAGVDGVIIPERRAVGLNATVAKASAGASEHMAVARVTNIARTVEELKQHNIWTVGLDERGTQS